MHEYHYLGYKIQGTVARFRVPLSKVEYDEVQSKLMPEGFMSWTFTQAEIDSSAGDENKKDRVQAFRALPRIIVISPKLGGFYPDPMAFWRRAVAGQSVLDGAAPDTYVAYVRQGQWDLAALGGRVYGVRIYGPDGEPREACHGWYTNEPHTMQEAKELAEHYNRHSKTGINKGFQFKAELIPEEFARAASRRRPQEPATNVYGVEDVSEVVIHSAGYRRDGDGPEKWFREWTPDVYWVMADGGLGIPGEPIDLPENPDRRRIILTPYPYGQEDYKIPPSRYEELRGIKDRLYQDMTRLTSLVGTQQASATVNSILLELGLAR